MKDNRLRLISALLAVTVLSSCSSTQIAAQRIDPPGSTPASEQGQPEGFIEDAMRLGEFNLLPDKIVSKIVPTVKNAKDPKSVLHDVHALICDGKHPRVTTSYQVHLIVPKPPQGTVLSDASEKRKNFIETARLYLKGHFFSEAAVPEEGKKYNDDFKNFKESKEEHKDHYLRGLALPIPVVFSQSRKEIEEYYKNLRLLPPNRDSASHFIGRSLYSLIFPNERTAVLVPRVFTFVGVGWDGNYGKKQDSQIGLVDNDTLQHFRGVYNLGYGASVRFGSLDRRPNFIVSDYGWKIEDLKNESWGHKELATDKPLFPLLAGSMSDLALLKKYYTFMVPRNVACKIDYLAEKSSRGEDTQYVDCDHDEGADMRQWGYDYHTKMFSPREALGNAWIMWDKLLANQTSIKEAAQPDGSIQFELDLDTSFFCEYGTPITDLVSQ